MLADELSVEYTVDSLDSMPYNDRPTATSSKRLFRITASDWIGIIATI